MNPILSISIALGALAFVGLLIASAWKIFEKANEPGWTCLIPFYNTYVMLKIAEMSGLWLLVLLIPYVKVLVWIAMMLGTATAFRKSGLFALGLVVLPFVFFPLLAFNENDKYHGGQRF